MTTSVNTATVEPGASTRRQDQNVAAGRKSHFRGNYWSCFDSLPAALRAAHHEAVVDWCPLEDRWVLNKMLKAGRSLDEAVAALVAATHNADADELVAFGRMLPRSFAGVSPHVAAGVSVQRYGRRGDGATERPRSTRRSTGV